MSKHKLVKLSEYIKNRKNEDDALSELKMGLITAHGKYSDHTTEIDLENGVLSVNAETGEYNPPPIEIDKDVWHTHSYDESSNILSESHEAGTMFGFSSYWDIIIADTENKKTHTPRIKEDPDWWEAVKRYISYIHHNREDFGLTPNTKLFSKLLWNILKKIKNKSQSMSATENEIFELAGQTIKITKKLCDEIEDLTECIQTIEPITRKSVTENLVRSGDEVLKYRPKTNQTKDTTVYGTFENKVNEYLKSPESFFSKNDLNKYCPKRGRNCES